MSISPVLQASARDTENATGGKETGGVGHRMVAASPAAKAPFSVVKRLLFSDRRACNKQLVEPGLSLPVTPAVRVRRLCHGDSDLSGTSELELGLRSKDQSRAGQGARDSEAAAQVRGDRGM